MNNYFEPDVKTSLEKYYRKNQLKIEKSYPGVTLGRFIQEFNQSNVESIEKFIEEIQVGKPFEYISNKKYFYEDDFYVNEDVLIPRNETELLVEKSIDFIKENNYKSVLEVGVGSGAVLLSIVLGAENILNAVGVDDKESCLKVASLNEWRKRFKLTRELKIEWLLSDRLEKISGQFDLIVTNPPYIKEKEDLHKVHPQVHQYEPHHALYLPDLNYFQWHRDLITSCYRHLKSNGIMILEGHEDHLIGLASIFENVGFTQVSVQPDLTQANRFIIGKKDG